MLNDYNGGTLFGNRPGTTAQYINLLGIGRKRKDAVDKARILTRENISQPPSSLAETGIVMGG